MDADLAAARALLDKARTLAETGRGEESRGAVAELVAGFEHHPAPEARRMVCRALFGQASGKLAEGVDRRVVIVDYRHILHIAERSPSIDDIAVAALYHVALMHGKIAVERASQDHREKALERFHHVEQRFGASVDPEIIYWVARAAMSHALMLGLDEAPPVYESLFRRYAQSPYVELRVYAATALTRWAERCLAEGSTPLAAQLAERVMSAFSANESLEMTELVESCKAVRDRARGGR